MVSSRHFYCAFCTLCLVTGLRAARQGTGAVNGHDVPLGGLPRPEVCRRTDDRAPCSIPGKFSAVAGVKILLFGQRVTLGDVRAVIPIASPGEAQDNFLPPHVSASARQNPPHQRPLSVTGGSAAPRIVENDTPAVKLISDPPGSVLVASVRGPAVSPTSLRSLSGLPATLRSPIHENLLQKLHV